MSEVADSGQNWAHIENLTPGEEYYFRVVAVNGLEPDFPTRETRSHPPWKELVGYVHGERVSFRLFNSQYILIIYLYIYLILLQKVII